jgi:hypothetical protein
VASAVAIACCCCWCCRSCCSSVSRTASSRRASEARGWFRNTALALGLGFLYVPILSMIVFSFNNSRLVTVWDGAHSPTIKWYRLLFANEQILGPPGCRSRSRR